MHIPPPKGRKVLEIVNEFQTDTTEIEGRKEPLLARSTLYLLLTMVAAFITWASLAELDKVVTSRGAIETISGQLVVQPLEMAIIKSINVRHGESVVAGQTLATLDPTFAQADALQVETRVRALDAQVARLDAEHAGQPFEPLLTKGSNAYSQVQKSLYTERRLTFASRLRTYDEKIAQVQSGIVRRQRDLALFEERLRVAREIEAMRAKLMQQETGSRLNFLISQNERIEIERNLELAANSIKEERHQLESTTSERESFIRNWESELLKELATTRADRDALMEQLSKLQKRSDLVRLETPEDAIVLDIAPLSVGSVVKEAEAMFRLVPKDAKLEVLAFISAGEIGNVKEGDEAEVKIDAFSFSEHGILKGRVRVISGDSFSGRDANPPGKDGQAPPQGVSYYKARIEILENNLINVPEGFRLIPGITLTAEIKVGKRSIMSYLLRPILRSFDEGLREP